ncbi:DNA polymerase III subunit gamma/tau [Aliikangiella maris]|uniref:DNA polymerase III subunit gamma/tau n=2 Tax=Aliikangiella maris TaxID=3162458 RepID=A0ABV2BUH9_9GAMM
MSYQVLARKWRPQNFSELVGQHQTATALSNALTNQRLHHAYLFTGTRGVGKTTIARILSKSLNCEKGITPEPCGECSSCVEISQGNFVDLLEIDAASKTKVEDTRELLDNVQYRPTRGRYKVYLIDEVHMLSGHSFNALLKTLEEPPPHVIFLLATTDPQKMPVTVLSRCLQFHLRRMEEPEIVTHLQKILLAENIELEAGALEPIAKGADGSMRDALSLLDQAIAYCGGFKVEKQTVLDMLGTIDRDYAFKIMAAINQQDASALMDEINTISQFSPDYHELLSDWLTLLHQIAVSQAVGGCGDPAIDELAQNMREADIQLYYQLSLHAKRDLPYAPHPRQGFEMVMLRILAFKPQTAPHNPTQKKTERSVQPALDTSSVSTPAKMSTSPAQSQIERSEKVESNSLAENGYERDNQTPYNSQQDLSVMHSQSFSQPVNQSKIVDEAANQQIPTLQNVEQNNLQVAKVDSLIHDYASVDPQPDNALFNKSDLHQDSAPVITELSTEQPAQRPTPNISQQNFSQDAAEFFRPENTQSVKKPSLSVVVNNKNIQPIQSDDRITDKEIYQTVQLQDVNADNWFNVVGGLTIEGHGLQVLLNSTANYTGTGLLINYLAKVDTLLTENAKRSIHQDLATYFNQTKINLEFVPVKETTETPKERLLKNHELAIDKANQKLIADGQVSYLLEKLEASIPRESIRLIE